MTKNTMTQAQALSMAIAFIKGEDIAAENLNEIVAKFEGMLHTIENKRSTVSKADREKQEQNENICATILTVLNAEKCLMTIKEMQDFDDELAEFSNQKMSAMLKKLIESGKVVKTIDKKITYFSLA